MKKIKRVVLVQPNMKWMDWNWKTSWDIHPLNLCLLGAMINVDYEVTVVDANLENHTRDQFKKTISDLKPDMVGLTLLTNEYSEVAHIGAELIREIDPKIITVLGGVYATVSYSSIYSDSNFDYICVGEGEYSFPQLLKYLNNEGEFPKEGFLGRREGELQDASKVVRTLIEDLDALPSPAWDLVDYSRYTRRVGKITIDHPYTFPYTRLMTSRGCPVGCTFCEVEVISGGPFRYQSPKKVLQELRLFKSQHGIKAFMLDDDNFFVNRKRVKVILKAMLEEKIDLEWKAHAVPVFHLDDEIVELMAKTGCRSVALAIESGSERVLKDVIRKPVKLDHVRHVCKKIKDVGMDLVANFIIGFPTETWDEIRQTFKFAEELEIDYSKFFIATPLEGTILHDMVMENNLMAAHSDTSGQMKDLNWSTSKILSDEWTMDDLTVLRGYEWERINFGTPERRKKLASMMGITEEELGKLRKDTFASVTANIITNFNHKNANGKVVIEHHGDHRSIGAESYPGVKLDRGEPVSFGF